MGFGAVGRVVAAVGGEIAEAEADCSREERGRRRLLWEQQEDEAGSRDYAYADVHATHEVRRREEEGSHVSQNK